MEFNKDQSYVVGKSRLPYDFLGYVFTSTTDEEHTLLTNKDGKVLRAIHIEAAFGKTDSYGEQMLVATLPTYQVLYLHRNMWKVTPLQYSSLLTFYDAYADNIGQIDHAQLLTPGFTLKGVDND